MKKTPYILLLPFALFAITACSEDKQKDNLEAQLSAGYDLSLSEYIDEYFSPLPSSAVSEENPLTDAKVNLGHHLYFDPRLSKNGTISCNSCHNLETFGVDNLATSPGDDGIHGGRNSPTVLNAALHFKQFWDGRAETIEQQAGMPIMNPVEMNIPNEQFLVQRLSEIELYKTMFNRAFPKEEQPLTYRNIEKAIGAFERTLVTPSRFDHYLNGEKTALNLQEKKGMMSFIKVGCIQCHTGTMLGANLFQKFGVYDDYWKHTKSKSIDNGLFDLNKDINMKYMFKVPTLRNIEHTSPYFHDGSVADLAESVKIMAKVQLNYELTQSETDNIVAFLKSLSGELPESVKKKPSTLTATK